MKVPKFYILSILALNYFNCYAQSNKSNIIIWPEPGPVMPIDGNNNSPTDIANNLKLQQNSLQQQLNDINQQLTAVNQFIASQTALHINWQNAKPGIIPAQALAVPLSNQETVHICRAQFMHGTHPGVVKNDGCLITYGGYSLILQTFQIATGKLSTDWQIVNSTTAIQNILQTNPIWQHTQVPIQGGFENNAPLYICRAQYQQQIYLGKVVLNNCNFAVGAKEIYINNFDVLFGIK